MSKTLSHEQRATNGKRQAIPIFSLGKKPQAMGATPSAPQAVQPSSASRPAGQPSTRVGAGGSRIPLLASHEVFSINFIRHEVVPLSTRRTLVYLALGSLAVNLLVLVGLLLAAASTRYQAHELQAQLHAKAADVPAHELETLRERAAGELTRLNAITTLQQQRFFVGGRLATLTRTLPARTWITSLSAERKTRTLSIHASYLVDAEKPYDLPTKGWIEALKADSVFSQGLTRLELGSSSRKRQGDAELYVFELAASWSY